MFIILKNLLEIFSLSQGLVRVKSKYSEIIYRVFPRHLLSSSRIFHVSSLILYSSLFHSAFLLPTLYSSTLFLTPLRSHGLQNNSSLIKKKQQTISQQ